MSRRTKAIGPWLRHNPELERANLEHMLVHPEHLNEYRALPSERDFHIAFHREVWRAIMKAQDAGAPLDGDFVVAVGLHLAELIPEMPNEMLETALGRLIRP